MVESGSQRWLVSVPKGWGSESLLLRQCPELPGIGQRWQLCAQHPLGMKDNNRSEKPPHPLTERIASERPLVFSVHIVGLLLCLPKLQDSRGFLTATKQSNHFLSCVLPRTSVTGSILSILPPWNQLIFWLTTPPVNSHQHIPRNQLPKLPSKTHSPSWFQFNPVFPEAAPFLWQS